jgi:hypothetical protein
MSIDSLLAEFTSASQLDSQIDAVIFRLHALKNGKTLFFKKNQNDDWSEWIPSFTNPNAILEGNDNCPSIIEMDIEWRIQG